MLVAFTSGRVVPLLPTYSLVTATTAAMVVKVQSLDERLVPTFTALCFQKILG